jgi:putative sterol carrier protein
MTLRFPSDEWIKELSARLDASESYERSAKDWEGDIVFVVESDDALPNTVYLFLSLYHGKSPDAALLASENEREAEFIIRGPFNAWRQVIEGEMDAVQGMMTRKFKVQGNLMKIMRYPKAVKEIVDCCALIETEFA